MTWWLSYGGGVNSTALAVLLVDGRLPEYAAFRIVFADTQDEKEATYSYIERVFRPWLVAHGRDLEIVRPREGVLERWQRLGVTGSRILRTCTSHGKIEPIQRHIAAHGGGGQLIGIDAGEAHRAKPARDGQPEKRFPLVDLDIDREGCVQIIEAAGLCVPPKSGCWHCPFSRVREVLALARDEPERFAAVEALEARSIELHPPPAGVIRAHWHDKPARYWRERAAADVAQGRLFETAPEMPCACWDGGDGEEP